jgi:hypothetical protein
MGLRQRVQNAVNKAFAKIDDLLLDAVFTNNEVADFNFTTGSVTSNVSTYSARGFWQEKSVMVEGTQVVKLTFLLKTEGVVFSGYTKAVIDGKTYTCSVDKSNEYTTELVLVRVD